MVGISLIRWSTTVGSQDLQLVSINTLLFRGICNPFNSLNNNKKEF